MWQASQMPFPTLAPMAFSTGKGISWISAPAWQCSCTASLFCHPAPSEQNKALMFTDEALVESSFLLAQEPGLLPVNKSHEEMALASLQQVCVPLQRFWTEDLADFGPETTARGIRLFPRFQLTVEKSRAEAAADKKSAIERKMSRGVSVGRLLPKRKTLTPPMLLQREPGSRQQKLAKEPPTSVLPPCAGSFRRTKTGEQKEASTAQTSTALPATEESKRVLQVLALPCCRDCAA
ncbi:uncharacterized protein LOC125684192 [Lagopus muta]|uniref:uncharacterized protein LOC125684190 n=1 Tax=Lagopus muta TaxID=64668 RepID=UPI0020A0F299|nr:uncharacterized protein LOC125684190 [Lagopus muta]XP_048782098.1 uncharacterized protein LOC125684191 [Lagopus muta]XP_048782099.1 uncharacterized protein LOC125684192 [Lagopus muta]